MSKKHEAWIIEQFKKRIAELARKYSVPAELGRTVWFCINPGVISGAIPLSDHLMIDTGGDQDQVAHPTDLHYEEPYLIQNGYVGNAVRWWNKDGKGYGTDPHGAELFTREKALKIITEDKGRTFKAWPVSALMTQGFKVIFDSQYFHHSKRLTPDDEPA